MRVASLAHHFVGLDSGDQHICAYSFRSRLQPRPGPPMLLKKATRSSSWPSELHDMKHACAMAVRIVLGAIAALTLVLSASAAVRPFPRDFRTQEIKTDGATIHVRVGGNGPAVVMLHGFGDTGDMWAPLAAVLAKDHTIIVPDLRGMGLSSYPDTGYDKKTQAQDIARVMDKLNVQKADLVTHDIGNMVGYALAAQYPDRITRWVVIDAPLPGIGPWDEILKSPLLWHFNFRGPDVDRLVKGRERIYLDRFWNELSANPESNRRGDAPTLRQDLCAARRHARRVQSVRCLFAGRSRQQGVREQRKADHADFGAGRGEVVRKSASCDHARGRH